MNEASVFLIFPGEIKIVFWHLFVLNNIAPESCILKILCSNVSFQ
jgi:hypothetical protein